MKQERLPTVGILIFDDVEDEFAIGAADDDGILRKWCLCGDLVDALRCILRV